MTQNFVVTQVLRVVMVGKDAYPENYASFSPDIHCNELIFHFSGQTTVHFDDLILETTADTIRFLPKGKFSNYEVFVHEPDECIYIDFQTDIPICEKAFVFDASKNHNLAPLFRKLFVRWMAQDEGSYFECISLLYKILSEMQKKNYSYNSHLKILKPAVDAILQGFLNTNFKIGELAEMCNISESYFKRLFKKNYGMPPKKYIIRLKINHACNLLRQKRYTVTQVAEICNFSDVYFFSRQFKNYVGITPFNFAKQGDDRKQEMARDQ